MVIVFITLLHAFIDSILIKQGKPIKHTLESFIWGGVCGIGWFIVGGNMWLYGLECLLVRAAFFDYSLNFFRGLPLSYKSLTTTSLIDKIESKLGIEDKVRFVSLLIFILWSFLKN